MKFQKALLPSGPKILDGHMAAGAGAMSIFLTSWVLVILAEQAVRRSLLPEGAIWAPLCASAGAYLMWLLLTSPLYCGEARRQRSLCETGRGPFSLLFCCFREGRLLGRALLAGLLTGTGRLLWGAVFLFPPAFLLAASLQVQSILPADGLLFRLSALVCITCVLLLCLSAFFLWVFLQRYGLTFFYLTQFPGLRVSQVIALSVRQTRGQRLSFALTRLRFLPLLLFAPLFWPVPAYYCLTGASRAALARELSLNLEAVPIPPQKRQSRFLHTAGKRRRACRKKGKYSF